MEKNRMAVRCMRAADTLLIATAFILSYFIKRDFIPEPYGGLSQDPSYYVVLLLVIIIWYIANNAVWIYPDLRQYRFFPLFFDILKANAAALLILGFVLYASRMPVSRLMIAIFLVLNLVFLVTFRTAAARVVKRLDTTGVNSRNVVVIGSLSRANDVIESLEGGPCNGVRILGCFDPDPAQLGRKVAGRHPVLGTMEGLRDFLTREPVDDLIVAMPIKKIPEGDKYLVMAEEMGINARIVPDWQLHYLAYQPTVASMRVAEFSGLQTLTLTTVPKNEGMLFIKSLLDYAAASVLLVLALPVFAAAGIAIICVSRGPVFYRQERLGKNGRVFELIKFRTMANNADRRIGEIRAMNECDGPPFKVAKDPRIIPVVGTLLRKTSMDELPQLINVLRGEMSLVGPRPPIPSEVDEYEIWHRRRLSMKPGITCLWQVTPRRNDLPFCKWVELDLRYIDRWSLGLDLIILAKTVRVVLTGQGR